MSKILKEIKILKKKCKMNKKKYNMMINNRINCKKNNNKIKKTLKIMNQQNNKIKKNKKIKKIKKKIHMIICKRIKKMKLLRNK